MATRVQETSYKILTRWYRIPSQHHLMFPKVPDSCWRCGAEGGTMVNIFWECPKVQQFWQDVTAIIKELTAVDLHANPAACLLHLTNLPIKKYKSPLTMQLLNAAKACILLCWRDADPPRLCGFLKFTSYGTWRTSQPRYVTWKRCIQKPEGHGIIWCLLKPTSLRGNPLSKDSLALLCHGSGMTGYFYVGFAPLECSGRPTNVILLCHRQFSRSSSLQALVSDLFITYLISLLIGCEVSSNSLTRPSKNSIFPLFPVHPGVEK